jgi:hypothetical protein
VALAPDTRILPAAPGTVEIEFTGRARLKITGPVDPSTMTALIKALMRIARR